MWRWALSGIAACASTPALTPATTTPAVQHTSRIAGRVLLDGRPVSYFGIVIERARLDPSPAIAIHALDGRFDIAIDGPLHGDVVIVGPSFARYSTGETQFAKNATTVLGTIAVQTGFERAGRVVDETGAPVAGATVFIGSTHTSPADGELAELAHSSYSAITDADGAWRIAHQSTERVDEIAIVPGKLASLSQTLAETIVVHPAGTLEARVGDCAPRMGGDYALVVHDLNHVREGTGTSSNTMPIVMLLPEGSYNIWYGKPAQPVTIVAGQTTVVTCP